MVTAAEIYREREPSPIAPTPPISKIESINVIGIVFSTNYGVKDYQGMSFYRGI
jgi:hypothetical protein